MAEGDYAGELSPEEAWERLGADADARLVDVRTDAEWTYVGVPDLSEMGKEALRISWQQFPDMRRNPRFAAELRRAGAGPGTALLFLCRSGVRSRQAAMAMTGLGLGPCYNIVGGFKGDADTAGHRGTGGGWKVAGLPWTQG